MKKILLASLFLLISKMAFATDLGTHGATYEIREKNLLDEIQEKLKEAQKNGKLAKFQNDVKKRLIDQTYNPQPVEGIVKATTPREWFFDPSISKSEDLKDQNGKVFYRAGTKVNPLDYLSLTKALIFIDGADKSQFKWALKQNLERKGRVKIILTNGSALTLMRENKVRIYFDQGGFLVKKFSIQAVPALIEQEGKMLKVREVVL